MPNRRDICTIVALIALAAVQADPQTTDPSPARPPAAEPAGDQVEKVDARSPRNASYDIDVRLDHQQRTLRGRETIRWRNISARPADELQFHLYWNGWRNRESTWMRERRFSPAYTPPRDDAWGAIDVTAIRVRHPNGAPADLTSQVRYLSPDDGNTADRTVMAVPAPVAVQPQETIEIDIEWTAKIPRPFARTGYIADYYFIAQWFPKIGVLEDGGWNTHQFHAVTEFYADYGVYDVDITVPAGFVVGASGREIGRSENADGTTTHRYRGEDIHDVAWTASPRFLESRRVFDRPGLNRVEMRLLLQPEHAGQEDRHFDATAATLRWLGEWFGAYPYDHITIVDPAYQSGSGGMEYPTLITAGTRWIAPRDVTVPESVTIHEAAHQWWYGVVGSNEFESAWMDEGLTMFGEPRVTEAADAPNRLALRFFGGFVPWVVQDVRLRRETNGNRLPNFRLSAEADAPSTPTYQYWPATATSITYDKTALWLHTLERHLGWPVVQRILSTYFERWKFRHPQPQDLFAIVNEVSGQDLTWFIDQVYGGSNTFDYAVQELTSERVGTGPYRTTVVAQRLGEAAFPVDVVTTFENGEQITERWDGASRRTMYVYERASRALAAQVDPRRVLLLDVNYTNNSRTLQPRSSEASRKWALKWMVWLQDLMLTYAFFV
jgi:aminopeptidase N